MFKKLIEKNAANEQKIREELNSLTEKELMIEMLIELKKINNGCDDIARKIVIWSD